MRRDAKTATSSPSRLSSDEQLRTIVRLLARQAARDAVQPCDLDQTKAITTNLAPDLSK